MWYHLDQSEMAKVLVARAAEVVRDIPEPRVESSAALAPRPVVSLAEHREKDIEKVTDALLTESQSILLDSMGFADLTDQNLAKNEPPQQWIIDLGRLKAQRKLRLAKMALLPKREAPVGLEQARALAVGIIASKAREKGGTKILNVAFVNVPAPPEYPVVTLEMKK